ncbi:uncharacterized protein VTP21DRAFT_6848 [Calcarisporiella thermophila]|uniref:uncharacterized protein n=1 Tax=Calcarisporiella thermophila TaxID=911321 RepID=UPI0037423B1C
MADNTPTRAPWTRQAQPASAGASSAPFMGSLPIPTTKSLAISSNQNFVTPIKRIYNESDLSFFLQSEAYTRYMAFVRVLNDSVVNKKIDDVCEESEATRNIIAMLEELNTWIDEIPPLQTSQRFGNKAFRDWVGRLEQNADRLIRNILPQNLHSAIHELSPYLAVSFGNPTRIDYGSGHELSFAAFLCALAQLSVLEPKDYTAIVLRIFVKYLEVVRRLQRVYLLEPAGSHGVWGLDDYQFLPYVWGSAQLRDHSRLKPSAVLKGDYVDELAPNYLYFRCIQFINEVKRGPFHEHSPMLYDISGVPTWVKVNSGMLKMYVAEVLGKFPVVQHFVFGTFFPWEKSEAVSQPAHPL